MIETRHVIVEKEGKVIGIDEQGFGEIDYYTVIKIHTSFPQGTRVLVTIKEDKTKME